MAASASGSDPDAFAVHGGRLSQAARRFPDAPRPWIDLSTGVSPWAYPAPPADRVARARLPEPEETAALEAIAGAAFGVAPERMLATPGAEAGLSLLAASLAASRVGVAQPTYGGHARAWRLTGADVRAISREALAGGAEGLDAVVAVNPNNPDGALTDPERLLALAGTMARRNGWLIVDEAFAEVAPQASVLPRLAGAASAERLVVLRSFGKFYGLPGLRLGFVVAEPGLIARLRERQGDWPVSADAIAAGRAAYADAAWAGAQRRRLARAAARLDRLLARAGLAVVGGTDLFRLVGSPDAAARFVRLAERGVLTRPFAYNPRWLRLGLPPPPHWPRLEAALMESLP
jgi:cobalamin biosynthetic protein CobC